MIFNWGYKVKYFFTGILFMCCYIITTAQSNLPIYKNIKINIEDRIKDLLSRMTIQEKILQTSQSYVGNNDNPNNINKEEILSNTNPQIGSLIYYSDDAKMRNAIQTKAMNTRLGIPILFGFDVIHGFKNLYPIPLAVGCSWNVNLYEQACMMAAKETYLAGINWTFSPMLDISRDPRWGRVSECYGEDVYTNAVFGVAAVKGYQGNGLSNPYSIAACLKHFVGYGLSEGGRDYTYTEISNQTLWDTYLIPYQQAINAGAITLMAGFNNLNGIPMIANHFLLTDIVKKRWQLPGFIVSDWNGVHQLIEQGNVLNNKEAALKAFKSGVDLDMTDDVYKDNLLPLLNEDKIRITELDSAVYRILKVKFMLGLFDNPYAPENIIDDSSTQLHDKLISEKLASESMVLLKNKNILPIDSKHIHNIAVIGPMSMDSLDLMGSWIGRGKEIDVTSVYTALKRKLNNVINISFAKGADFDGTDTTGFEDAYKAAMTADLCIICLGEKGIWSGENASRSSIELPYIQEQLIKMVSKAKKPIVLVLFNGRPLALKNIEPYADAILESWQPGTMGAFAVADILSGKSNPSGKLDITFPLTSGQIPIYYSMRPKARPSSGNYQDISTQPLYPFGYGLSYSKFAYDSIKLSSSHIKKEEHLIARINVQNISDKDGLETVLWYITDKTASITRPIKELRFFEKKEIKKNNTKTFIFDIDPLRDLSYPDADGNKILEPGEFIIEANGQKASFDLIE